MLSFAVSVALAFDVAKTVPIAGDPRKVPVSQVVIHATGGPSCDPRTSFKGGTLDSMVDLFATRTDGVSIHYIVGEDGTIVAMVPEEQVAGHAKGHNGNTIGIEVVNDGDGIDPFPAAQIAALEALSADILARRHLPVTALTTHDAVDSRWFSCAAGASGTVIESESTAGSGQKRKVDPGPAFPWDEFTKEVAARLPRT